MSKFSLEDSSEYYLYLSENPKRFDADSLTNVFFDDTNGQVFTVRSGGVTGVTVVGMDDSRSTSFRMEDKGPIVLIKFSLDHNILAIQRHRDSQNACVEFINFKDLQPTNVTYTHCSKWKNAKILAFVWCKVNEIAFITDHGIELLQVVPEKKILKSLKNTSFSCAWHSWCPQSKIVLLASNNGTLLQPFSLNNSTITKMPKIELEAGRPVAERDVFVLRTRAGPCCAVFRHAQPAAAHTGPTEISLTPIGGGAGGAGPRVLRTGLAGRFAVSVVDGLIVVHHQSSQTSLLFDIEESSGEAAGGQAAVHAPAVRPRSMRPASLGDRPADMYSDTWVVFPPAFCLDAARGCLWRLQLDVAAIAHEVPHEQLARVTALLLRRAGGGGVVLRVLRQLARAPALPALRAALGVVLAHYSRYEAAPPPPPAPPAPPAPPSPADLCAELLQPCADAPAIVQVVSVYLLCVLRAGLQAPAAAAALCVRALLTRGAGARLVTLVRRGCLADGKPLACQLLSLARLHPPAAQLALDMLARLGAHEEVIEVVLQCGGAAAALGAARQLGALHALPPRKLLAHAAGAAGAAGGPGAGGAGPAALVAVYRALQARNERTRGAPAFLKSEQCEEYDELYRRYTSEQ